MANIVLAHGAWSAAWAWKKMRPLFAAAGHTFYSPSYTGLGERAHLARPDIDLSTLPGNMPPLSSVKLLKYDEEGWTERRTRTLEKIKDALQDSR